MPDISKHIAKVVDEAGELPDEDLARIRAIFSYSGPRREQVEPKKEKAPKRVALYRHFDKDGVLLYIGITSGLQGRTNQHAGSSVWSDFVASSEATWFETREEAAAAETAAIRSENPLFNGTSSTPEARIACAKYLADKNRFDLLGIITRTK